MAKKVFLSILLVTIGFSSQTHTINIRTDTGPLPHAARAANAAQQHVDATPANAPAAGAPGRARPAAARARPRAAGLHRPHAGVAPADAAAGQHRDAADTDAGETASRTPAARLPPPRPAAA